ncbi:MAG: MgtC/SapB family protein [Chloroflexi bacterium]|nr:MgtC/SapB family protein [Chloroflexota bacterium]
MILYPEDVIKLFLALALGGVIGAEREVRDKSAGFRTLMFICAGSALFTIFSMRLASSSGAMAGDPARIAAQIVSGIGFLGAGVILREHGEVRGLTTASTIWLVAALGMGVGSGSYLFSGLATIVILLALLVFPSIEHVIGTRLQQRTYYITTKASLEKYESICSDFQKMGLHILSRYRTRRGGMMTVTLVISGSPKRHEKMADQLFEDPTIIEIEARS